MGYGVNKWASTNTTARRARVGSASARKRAKKSKSKTAKRAPKRSASRASKITSSKKKSAPRSTRAKSAKRRKLPNNGRGWRVYDLADGGKLQWVKDQNDPRWTDQDDALAEGREARYVHTKPSKATKQKFIAREIIGSSPIADAVLSPTGKTVLAAAAVSQAKKVPTILKAARNVATGLGTIALDYGIAGAGLVAAAGFGSYFATKWIMENYPTRQRRLDAAADAYRKSRRDLAATLGRALTPGELAQLSARYKEIVRKINS